MDDYGKNLCFGELQRCFLPCDSSELRATLSQRPCKKKKAYLPLVIEEKISALIVKEIDFLKKSEKMRHDLQARFDFSTYACFSAIVNSEALCEGGDKSRIRDGPLGKFLIRNGYYATSRELKAILRRLDVD